MKDESRIKRKLKRGRQLYYLGTLSLKKDGVRMTAGRVLKMMGLGKAIAYRRWARTPLYTEEELETQRAQDFGRSVLFSIITPLYNTKEEYLREMIESVQAQTYSGWELCMADGSDGEHEDVGRSCREYAEKDQRIKYRKLEENLGICGNSNACLDMAAGDYIGLLDHDDVLHPAALHDVMETVCGEDADFIYSDEIIFQGSDLNRIFNIHFKKDFAPDDLRVNNYICHFTAFRRDLIERCGPFRDGFDGSQDHELFLRLTGEAERIAHIPRPLYYWRAHGESTAESGIYKPYAGESGKKAVMSSLNRAGIAAKIENARDIPTIYRVSYEIPADKPLVSIIIPNCDHAGDLTACVRSIMEKTTYPEIEIIIIENNSKSPGTFSCYEELTSHYDNVSVITWPGSGFNWAAINNFAVRAAAGGDYILLLNNDIEVITPEWIEEMLMHAQRPEIGAVGAMLYYPDDTVQHAGVIIGLNGEAGHAFNKARRGDRGYMGRLCFAQNLSAVTGACMMVRRSVYEEAGGFDERYEVALNDVDFCLRLREAGYLIMWTPYAELYHFESKSRGLYDTPENRARAEHEKSLFRIRWADILKQGDPYYNPNLTILKSTFEPDRRE